MSTTRWHLLKKAKQSAEKWCDNVSVWCFFSILDAKKFYYKVKVWIAQI